VHLACLGFWSGIGQVPFSAWCSSSFNSNPTKSISLTCKNCIFWFFLLLYSHWGRSKSNQGSPEPLKSPISNYFRYWPSLLKLQPCYRLHNLSNAINKEDSLFWKAAISFVLYLSYSHHLTATGCIHLLCCLHFYSFLCLSCLLSIVSRLRFCSWG